MADKKKKAGTTAAKPVVVDNTLPIKRKALQTLVKALKTKSNK